MIKLIISFYYPLVTTIFLSGIFCNFQEKYKKLLTQKRSQRAKNPFTESLLYRLSVKVFMKKKIMLIDTGSLS